MQVNGLISNTFNLFKYQLNKILNKIRMKKKYILNVKIIRIMCKLKIIFSIYTQMLYT